MKKVKPFLNSILGFFSINNHAVLFNIFSNFRYFLLFVFLFMIMGSLSYSMIIDEGIWSYMGRIWNRNRIIPYTGAIENKTPGIFYIYAISDIIFGVNPFFARIIGLLSLIGSCILLFHLCKNIYNRISGLISMYIFGFSMTWGKLFDSFTMQTEMPMIFFSILSFFLLQKGKRKSRWGYWVLIAGFSMGLAIAFKQIAITTSIAALLFFVGYTSECLSVKNRIVGFFLFCTGVILATFFSLIPLFLYGITIVDYFEGAWLILLSPGSANYNIYYRYLGFKFIFFHSRLVLFYPILFLLYSKRKLFKERYFIVLISWFTLDFIGANASGNYYGHQILQIMPSLAVITGILISQMLSDFQLSESRSLLFKNLTFLLIIILMMPYREISTLTHKQRQQETKIGIWIKNNSGKDDFVYMLGHLRFDNVLSISERISSSKYFNSFFVTDNLQKEIVYKDLIEKPPLYVFRQHKTDISKMYGERVIEFINTNYTIINPWISGPSNSNYSELLRFDLLKRNF